MRTTGPGLIVAHRGATGTAYENTIAAFEAAIRLGADLVECDLRRTADGCYLIHHDLTVGRAAIARCTSSEVRKKGRALGYEIPTLDELLEVISGRIGLDLELKEEGYEVATVNYLLKRTSPDRFVITSFHPGSIKTLKACFPEVRCGILLAKPSSRSRLRTADEPSRRLTGIRQLKADFVAAHWKHLQLGAFPGKLVHGLPIWVWTVNERSALERCLTEKRVEAVITDKVELALAVRDGDAL
ncbi:MAG: glycerophosphodiester phosphodiesterase [Verrucomicrobia bacterium]|nr:glycerophosphodiester phosphodiesterase [Verrucomicrobiota bacterium]